MHAMVAAHPTYPFGTVVRVTNLRNRRSVRVQIVDRDPAAGPRADGVIIDLSYGAARSLRFLQAMEYFRYKTGSSSFETGRDVYTVSRAFLSPR